MVLDAEVEQGMERAMIGGGVVQAGLTGEEQGGLVECSGVCVGSFVGGGEVQ